MASLSKIQGLPGLSAPGAICPGSCQEAGGRDGPSGGDPDSPYTTTPYVPRQGDPGGSECVSFISYHRVRNPEVLPVGPSSSGHRHACSTPAQGPQRAHARRPAKSPRVPGPAVRHGRAPPGRTRAPPDRWSHTARARRPRKHSVRAFARGHEKIGDHSSPVCESMRGPS